MVLIIAPLLSGCAARWIDDQGDVHVVGLVAMTIRPDKAAQDRPAHLIVETVGTSLIMSPPASALSIGYTKDELYFVGFPQPTFPRLGTSEEEKEDASAPPP